MDRSTKPDAIARRGGTAARAVSAARAGLAALACVALVSFAAPAQAQDVTLVSNTGQSRSGVGLYKDFDHARAFTTGSNSDGYKLTSVEINSKFCATSAVPGPPSP